MNKLKSTLGQYNIRQSTVKTFHIFKKLYKKMVWLQNSGDGCVYGDDSGDTQKKCSLLSLPLFVVIGRSVL